MASRWNEAWQPAQRHCCSRASCGSSSVPYTLASVPSGDCTMGPEATLATLLLFDVLRSRAIDWGTTPKPSRPFLLGESEGDGDESDGDDGDDELASRPATYRRAHRSAFGAAAVVVAVAVAVVIAAMASQSDGMVFLPGLALPSTGCAR